MADRSADAALPGDNAKKVLAGFIDRVEGLEAERAEVAAKIKAEFEQAAGAGFDKKALKQILKERKSDSEKSAEHRGIVDTYRRALATLAGTPLGDWARGWMADDTRLRKDDKAPRDAELDDFLKRRSSGESTQDEQE